MWQENYARLNVHGDVLIIHAPKPGRFSKLEPLIENRLKNLFTKPLSCRLITVFRSHEVSIGEDTVKRIDGYIPQKRPGILLVAGTETPPFLEVAMVRAAKLNYQVWNFATPCSNLDDLWHKLADEGFFN
jgi:hypothetical protein